MSEDNTPNGIDLTEATNAISALLSPEMDNDEEADDALDQEDGQEGEEFEGEQPEDDEPDPEAEDDADENEDQSANLLDAEIEVDGDKIKVGELKNGYLRQRDYTRKTQELSETRKAFQVEVQEVEQERAQYAQLLPALRQQVEAMVQQEPDWDKLYDADPAMAARAERQWKKQQSERNAQLQAISAESDRVNAARQMQLERAQAEHLAKQSELLTEIIPAWRDKNVAKKEATDVRTFLLDEGFSDTDINGITNAKLVSLARMAMLYAKGTSRAQEVKSKPRPAKAKMMKAGSSSTVPQPRSQVREAQQRLRKSGRVDDAAAIIRNML